MAYEEISRVEILDVVRRWQSGESRRAIARAMGLARNTVGVYVTAAEELGITAQGNAPSESQITTLVRFRRPGPAPGRPSLASTPLYGQHDRIRTWIHEERLRLTRVHELLEQEGVRVSYTTLRRFVVQEGLRQRPRTTVRMTPTVAGEVAEMDFTRLATLVDRTTGKRHTVWALVVVLTYSRHAFVWPLVRQTLEEVVAGLEAAWWFFGGVPHRVVLDNFPAAVAGTDPLAPRLTRGFLEYSQARAFLGDPARVRHPQDKPHVERFADYVTERFWKGGSFTDLNDARHQARAWCRDVAGQRVHGTTHRVPLVVFTDEERAALTPLTVTPAGASLYTVPLWRLATVHPDHHIQFAQALYSAPTTTCPPGTKLEVRGDNELVRLYRRGELVKVHARQPRGGRATDPDDYPTEKTTYALRAPDRLVRQAVTLGAHTGAFATRLLSGPMPWAALRQGYKLVRLAERYTPERLDAACARALGFDLIDVRRLERILALALEHEGGATTPTDTRVVPLGRFARPATAFDHRHAIEVER